MNASIKGLATVLFVSLAAPAQSAVVFGSAEISTYASAFSFNGRFSAEQKGVAADTVSLPVAEMNALTNTVAEIGGAFAQAGSTAIATFDRSGASGSFSNTSRLFVGVTDPGASARALAGGYAYRYDFSLLTPGNFSLAYRLNQNALGNAAVFLTGPSSLGGIAPNRAPGTFSGALLPGNYRLTIDTIFGITYGNDLLQAGVGTRSDPSLIDFYAFSVSPVVPEPETWILMLVGFGFAGWSIRRARVRRHLASVAA